MPSVSSSSSPKVLLSSTVMTPSLPTLSMASAIISPMAVSPAEMDAVEAICSLVSTSLETLDSSSLTRSTAASMPRLSDIGFAPAATLRRPSRTSACASTVAVVVPSPATSSVFLATSLTSSAPIFSHGSSSSISLAMDTPSLVIVGAPHFFSSTTFRPFGPRVTFTASASWFMPRSRPRLASSLNAIIFAAIGSSPPGTLCLAGRSGRCPRRTAGPQAFPSCPGPASSPDNASAAVTLTPRVPTPCLALSKGECKLRAWSPGSTAGQQGHEACGQARGPAPRHRGAGPPARQSEVLHGPDGVCLRSAIALRDLEFHPLSLFQGAVPIRLDSREMDEHVPTVVDRDKAVALVRVEPLDGALSHPNNSLTFARAAGSRPCYAGARLIAAQARHRESSAAA